MKHNILDKRASLLRRQYIEKEAQSEDIKVNMLDVAEIGAGAKMLQASTDRLLGIKTLYHGTSKGSKGNIMAEGLKSNFGGSGGAGRIEQVTSAGDSFNTRSKNKVHTSGSRVVSNIFARINDAADVANKNLPLRKALAKPAVIEMKMPYKHYVTSVIDEDTSPFKGRLGRHIGNYFKSDIPTKNIVGAADHSKRAIISEAIKEFPVYARTYPGRIGTGAVLVGTGTALLGAGVNKVTNKLRNKTIEKSELLEQSAEKTAGLKMWKRILEAELKAENPRIINNKEAVKEALKKVTAQQESSRSGKFYSKGEIPEKYLNMSKDELHNDIVNEGGSILKRIAGGKSYADAEKAREAAKLALEKRRPEFKAKEMLEALKEDTSGYSTSPVDIEARNMKIKALESILQNKGVRKGDPALNSYEADKIKRQLFHRDTAKYPLGGEPTLFLGKLRRRPLSFDSSPEKYIEFADSAALHPRLRLAGIKGHKGAAEAVARLNKDVDIRATHRHDINASKPLEERNIGLPAGGNLIGRRNSKGNIKLDSSKKDTVLYTGKGEEYTSGGRHSSSLTPGELRKGKLDYKPIWTTPHPEVAVAYSRKSGALLEFAPSDKGVVFAFKNTPEVVKGGAPRAHAHVAKDTRGISEKALKQLEEKSSFNVDGSPTNYERVINFNPKVLKDNLHDVYGTSYTSNISRGKRVSVLDSDIKLKYVRNVSDDVGFSPTLPYYSLRGNRREEAISRLFDEKVVTPTPTPLKDQLAAEVAESPIKGLIGGVGVTGGVGGGIFGLSKWRERKQNASKESPTKTEDTKIKKAAALKEDIELYPHQDRAINRIRNKNNTIVAHAVGSGKTLTTIGGFEKSRADGKAKKALVVVPASLRANYGEEGVKKFTDSTYNIVGNKQEIQSRKSGYGEVNKDSDYNIVSYELFRSNPEKYISESGADTVIFDELHRSKNPTKTYEAIRDTRHMYDKFIGGTGSVVSNKLTDILPLIDAATAGEQRLTKPSTLQEFKDKYFVYDNSPRYKDVHESRKPIVGLRNKRSLAKFLGEYVDYTDYDDVKDLADMPDKRINIVKVPVSKDQAAAYKRLLRDDKSLRKLVAQRRYDYLRDDEMSRMYNKLIEARKLMNDVGTVQPGVPIEATVEQSPKTKAMLDQVTHELNSNPESRVLLTSFLVKGGTEAIEAGLRNRGIEYGRFIGKGNDGVTEESRQKDVEDFNKGRIRALVLSSAGGEGLSLNDTTQVNVLDPHFNPERLNQIEARGIRSGGLKHLPEEERAVDVNRYVATMPDKKLLFFKWKDKLQTPDEVIYEIAGRKEKQNKVLQNFLKDITI